MADITIQFDMDDDPESISRVLDAITGVSGAQMFGLQVDGEHRDPDEPSSGLFD